MVNINLIPKKQMIILDAQKESSEKIKDQAEGKHIKDPKIEMSENEYKQMYDAGYVNPGIKEITIRCRKCGASKTCSQASEMAHTLICSSCKKKSSRGVQDSVSL